jgi:hypothetical protein
MKKPIKEDKQIKINGQIVFVKQVRRCHYDIEKDNPFSSTQNECRWRAFLSVKSAWEQLDAEMFLHTLTSDFEYSSYWVNNTMRGLDTYAKYIKGKFDSIAKTNSKPEISIVVLREGISPVGYTYALLLKQGDSEGLLLFDFLGSQIANLCMTDPDIYAFDSYRIGILDGNGEPRMFKHNVGAGRTGKKMTHEELLSFATEIIATLLNERGLGIISVYPKPDIEYPNVVYDETGTRCFVRLLPFLPPAMDADVEHEIFAEFINLAHRQNAVAIIQPVGLYCMETMGETAICGATFAAKFTTETIG